MQLSPETNNSLHKFMASAKSIIENSRAFRNSDIAEALNESWDFHAGGVDANATPTKVKGILHDLTQRFPGFSPVVESDGMKKPSGTALGGGDGPKDNLEDQPDLDDNEELAGKDSLLTREPKNKIGTPIIKGSEKGMSGKNSNGAGSLEESLAASFSGKRPAFKQAGSGQAAGRLHPSPTEEEEMGMAEERAYEPPPVSAGKYRGAPPQLGALPSYKGKMQKGRAPSAQGPEPRTQASPPPARRPVRHSDGVAEDVEQAPASGGRRPPKPTRRTRGQACPPPPANRPVNQPPAPRSVPLDRGPLQRKPGMAESCDAGAVCDDGVPYGKKAGAKPFKKAKKDGSTSESIMKDNIGRLSGYVRQALVESAKGLRGGKHAITFNVAVLEGDFKNRTTQRKQLSEALADAEEILQLHNADNVALEATFSNGTTVVGRKAIPLFTVAARLPLMSEGKALFRFRRNAEGFANDLVSEGLTCRVNPHVWGALVEIPVMSEDANTAFADIAQNFFAESKKFDFAKKKKGDKGDDKKGKKGEPFGGKKAPPFGSK